MAGLLSFQKAATGDGLVVSYAGQRAKGAGVPPGRGRPVFTEARGRHPRSPAWTCWPAGDGQSEGGRLTAPMPGKVVSFAVKAGDVVKKGQPLAVMEHENGTHRLAPPMARVELMLRPGDQVTEGSELPRGPA